jgi:transposase
MDVREERGKAIADTCLIRKSKVNDFVYLVPSQSGNGQYSVDLAGEEPTCTCPDWELRRKPCKHVFATAYTVVRQNNSDGSVTVTQTLTVAERKTYPQAWSSYNKAQTTEQDRFQQLLCDLCAGVEEPAPKFGRPPMPLKDMIFSAVFKTYSTFSGRRFMSDLREAKERGFLWKVPHYNSIFRYLESESLTPILKQMVIQSSLPLANVEVDFAVDSSGFSTSRFVRWFDQKYGRIKQKAEWVKAHIMCGVKTNVITAIEIGEKWAGDSPFLAPMVKTTAQGFTISEVSADKAYSSEKNWKVIAGLNAMPYIPFRSNTTGDGTGSVLWEHLFHLFMFRKQDFLSHYHKRSNIESTFSALKRKFGDSLRSKTDIAMVNEALCKVICHNLVVLIHETEELGIETMFWNKSVATA